MDSGGSKQHFEVYVRQHFSAAHHLRGYPGKCEKPHGHNWIVDVYVRCDRLNNLGIGIDFNDIKAVVKSVLERVDHCDLNELADFADQNPSSENIAAFLYREVSIALNANDVRVSKVRVCETPGAGAPYWED